MAANYPDDPSPETQRLMLNFFEALAHLYPCTYCAEDFQELIKAYPPRYFIINTASWQLNDVLFRFVGWSLGLHAVFGYARHTMT